MANWADSGGMGRSMRGPDNFTSVEELSSYLRSTARPFVLISERELSVLRRGLTKQGWKRALYLQSAAEDSVESGVGLLARANQWIERDIEIPGRSGHYHHFFCEDGTRLEVPEDFKLQKDGYKCPACGRVYKGDRYDGAMRWFQNQQIGIAAQTLALVYGIEKDKVYAEKAAEILIGCAKKYPGPHTSTTEGGQMYQSLCESLWIIRLAQAYDLIYHCNVLHDEDRKLIEQRLFRPCAQGLMKVEVQGNWGSWHLSAVGVVGLAIKEGEFVFYALDKFKKQISDGLGSDGLWPESVHCYHFFPLKAFIYFAEACYRAGIDLYNWEASPGKGLKAMFTAPVYYTYPSFQLPAINDGWYHAFLPMGLYEIAYRRWGGQLFAWVLKTGYRFGDRPINAVQEENAKTFKRNSFYAFLFGRDLPGRVTAPTLPSTHFTSLGICTLRSEGTMVTFDYGPFFGHGQLDKMGITIYGADRILAPDYGTPGYGAKILGYYTGTSSHNTVVVDGKPQQKTSDKDLIEFRSGDVLQIAEAETNQAYPGVTHRRRVVMAGGICVVYDKLTSDREHSYDWLLHAEGDLSSNMPAARSSKEDFSYEHAEILKVYEPADEINVEWATDNSGMLLRMWTDAPAAFAVSNFPAETGARKTPALIVRRRGTSAEFLGLMCPYSGTGRTKVEVENGILKISSGKSVYWMRFADIPQITPTGSAILKSDAQVAVVETVNGQPVRCAFLKGKEVIWNKEVLIESSDFLDHFEAQLQARSPIINYTGGSTGFLRLRSTCRAMRLNGQRVSASNTEGIAVLKLLPKPRPLESIK